MHSMCKYLISSFIVVLCCLQQCCLSQSTTVRPYKFGFTIDQQQHRSEKRDERGIVMGEFGFITADGIYHVTVYATDEQGRFRILAMKNYPYESPPKTVEVIVQPKTPIKSTTSRSLKRHNFNTEACSGCFLTNGNNKPKEPNNVQGKTKKSGVRPLSKSLDSSFNFPTSPKLPNKLSPETKGNKLMQNSKILPLNNTTPQNAFQHTSIMNSPENLQTKTKAQENTLQNTLSMNSVVQAKVTQLLPLKSILQTRNTISRSSEKQFVEMPTTTLTKQSTTESTVKIFSKDTNQKTSQPSPGRSNVLSASKITTDNPPPIMDIIMQKVLPTLKGAKGILSPSISTTLSNRPNVIPSNKNPSGNSSPDSERKAGGSVNGDGDLYRYKYILEYNGHSETGKRNGNKEGTYKISDDNVEHSIEYLANEFGYQPHIHWRKLDSSEIKSKGKNNTLKDYEFVWFNQ